MRTAILAASDKSVMFPPPENTEDRAALQLFSESAPPTCVLIFFLPLRTTSSETCYSRSKDPSKCCAVKTSEEECSQRSANTQLRSSNAQDFKVLVLLSNQPLLQKTLKGWAILGINRESSVDPPTDISAKQQHSSTVICSRSPLHQLIVV